MMTPPDPRALKQIIDGVGYGVMGIVGVFSAWQRTRAVTTPGAGFRFPGRRSEAKMPLRIDKLEQEILSLSARQNELQTENKSQHESMQKQQSAMFDLLVQQRGALDKILTKMGGLQ